MKTLDEQSKAAAKEHTNLESLSKQFLHSRKKANGSAKTTNTAESYFRRDGTTRGDHQRNTPNNPTLDVPEE